VARRRLPPRGPADAWKDTGYLVEPGEPRYVRADDPVIQPLRAAHLKALSPATLPGITAHPGTWEPARVSSDEIAWRAQPRSMSRVFGMSALAALAIGLFGWGAAGADDNSGPSRTSRVMTENAGSVGLALGFVGGAATLIYQLSRRKGHGGGARGFALDLKTLVCSATFNTGRPIALNCAGAVSIDVELGLDRHSGYTSAPPIRYTAAVLIAFPDSDATLATSVRPSAEAWPAALALAGRLAAEMGLQIRVARHGIRASRTLPMRSCAGCGVGFAAMMASSLIVFSLAGGGRGGSLPHTIAILGPALIGFVWYLVWHAILLKRYRTNPLTPVVDSAGKDAYVDEPDEPDDDWETI
jgi:hypothetical protein